MSDLRSSQQQLRDELDTLYREMTDPEEQAKLKRRKKREQTIKSIQLDYGL